MRPFDGRSCQYLRRMLRSSDESTTNVRDLFGRGNAPHCEVRFGTCERPQLSEPSEGAVSGDLLGLLDVRRDLRELAAIQRGLRE